MEPGRTRAFGLMGSLLLLAAASVVVMAAILLTVHPTRIGNVAIVVGVTVIVAIWALFPRAWLASWWILAAVGVVAALPFIVTVGWYVATRPAQFDVNRIRKSGGEVYFADCYRAFRDWAIGRQLEEFLGDCYFARPESVDLRKPLGDSLGDLPLGRFEDVSIRTTKLNADDLVGISHVKALRLIACRIDEGTDYLLGYMPNLEILDLWNTDLLELRLARSGALPKLKCVTICNCQLSEVATQSLSSLSGLQELYIERTLLAESELMQIARLKGLKWLVVEKSKVAVETQKSLQKSLPRCRVICQ